MSCNSMHLRCSMHCELANIVCNFNALSVWAGIKRNQSIFRIIILHVQISGLRWGFSWHMHFIWCRWVRLHCRFNEKMMQMMYSIAIPRLWEQRKWAIDIHIRIFLRIMCAPPNFIVIIRCVCEIISHYSCCRHWVMHSEHGPLTIIGNLNSIHCWVGRN